MDTISTQRQDTLPAYTSVSSSEDEEEDRRAFNIWQALPVPNREPDWAAGNVDTVEEYLCRVRCDDMLRKWQLEVDAFGGGWVR